MGIVNLTDDSFFVQSRCRSVDAALSRISDMLEEGADIIDLGACSTRPGSQSVGAEEEWHRLRPVLTEVRSAFPDLRISIDTYWSAVVSNAYDLIGDFIVNDISAGEDDPQMLDVVGSLGLTYIAMHKRGTPENMQELTDYSDIVAEMLDYFRKFEEKARAAGVRNWVLDPGFGFSKTLNQNWEVLRNLGRFKSLCDESGKPRKILVGISRKSMIYNLLNLTPEQSLAPTQVAHLAALQGDADILRVHDVAQTRHTVHIFNQLTCRES